MEYKKQISETESYKKLAYAIINQAVEDCKLKEHKEEAENFLKSDDFGALIYLTCGNEVNPAKIRKLIFEEIGSCGD